MKWEECQFLYKKKLKDGLYTRCGLGTSMDFELQCQKEKCMILEIYNKIIEGEKENPNIKS